MHGLALRVVGLGEELGAAHNVGGRERGGCVVPHGQHAQVVASPGHKKYSPRPKGATSPCSLPTAPQTHTAKEPGVLLSPATPAPSVPVNGSHPGSLIETSNMKSWSLKTSTWELRTEAGTDR